LHNQPVNKANHSSVLQIIFVLGEANLFEEALQKYGKDFTDIHKDFVSISFYLKFNKI